MVYTLKLLKALSTASVEVGPDLMGTAERTNASVSATVPHLLWYSSPVSVALALSESDCSEFVLGGGGAAGAKASSPNPSKSTSPEGAGADTGAGDGAMDVPPS
mmetsp:Transcript_17405/g.27346  ORF Transcript_17405/g.27346 Transcript_17405/m.27346 type:complete len:104 (+) Transcript_17405:543-854(+)